MVKDDPLLSSIFGGLLIGVGLGLIFKAKATSGGSDIVAMIISKYTKMPLGQLMIFVDATIVLVGLIAFKDWRIPLYSLIVIFITGKVVDVILEGMSYDKVLFIISEKTEEIKDKIVGDLNRGGTLVHGEGMYSGNDKSIVFTVVTRREMSMLQEFIHQTLGKEGLAKSVVVAAPANISPVLRLKATHLTHLIAEYFRNRGQNVLMLCDSLTRVAHAQREIGLAIGEPPTAKGYPPSVFALLPRLIERAGVGRNGLGSITAVYTVLAEGDDRSDPIVDIARASLDGQVMLSRQLADAAHYPAIDLAGSISRVMTNLVSPALLNAANRFRRLWTLYQQNQDLIQVGAYEAGTNADLDEAIRLRSGMETLLQQASDESVSIEDSHKMLQQLTGQPGN